MKKLIILSTFFFSISVHALPDCPSDKSVRWDNCSGTYTFGPGDFEAHVYVGEWKDDKFHGQGTYTWADGTKYVGEWKDGKRHGQGTQNFFNGQQYVGEWKDGKAHGQGTYTWPNQGQYVGEHKDGNRHGQGTHTFPDGDQYVGEYKEGRWHGRGTYIFTDGRRDDGYFMKDKYIPDICEAMGLVKGTESFGSCVVKLIDDL